MEIEETSGSPTMPRKVTAAIIVMWCTVAIVALGTAGEWIILDNAGRLGDFLYYYPVQMLSGPLLAAGVALVATRFRSGQNWARITGVVLGVTGGLCSFSLMATSVAYLLSIPLFWVMFGLLLTGDARRWCGAVPRRQRT
jgi:hypothetical protein